MVHRRIAVLLLFAVCLQCGSAEQLKDDGFVQQFRSMPPTDRVAAFGLLTELHALQQVAEEAAAAGAAGARLQQLQQQLKQLLPLLQESATSLPALQQQAAATLAADLAPPAPSRLARALTLVNIGWFVGIVLVVLALFSLVGIYLAALLMLVPKEVYEGLGYLLSLWVLRKATLCAPHTAPYVGLTGLLLFTACVSGTIALHLRRWFDSNKSAPTIMMALFTLLYAAVAIRLQATLIGTIAVWWAVSALGFTIMVFPFLSVIGFRAGMAAPFTASLALILVFLPFKAVPELLPMPTWLQPFQTGVWLWCTLVLNVANLIMAHRGWEKAGLPPYDYLVQIPPSARLRLLARVLFRYLLAQVPAVAVIGGTLACGVLLEVEQCRAIGSVFAFIWFLSKLSECNWKRAGFAWTALVFGGLLWGAAYAVHMHPHIISLHLSLS